MPILPVGLVTRTAAQHNVQHDNRGQNNAADADRDVEGRKIAVDRCSLVWIVQVLGTLFDCRHRRWLETVSSAAWRCGTSDFMGRKGERKDVWKSVVRTENRLAYESINDASM